MGSSHTHNNSLSTIATRCKNPCLLVQLQTRLHCASASSQNETVISSTVLLASLLSSPVKHVVCNRALKHFTSECHSRRLTLIGFSIRLSMLPEFPSIILSLPLPIASYPCFNPAILIIPKHPYLSSPSTNEDFAVSLISWTTSLTLAIREAVSSTLSSSSKTISKP